MPKPKSNIFISLAHIFIRGTVPLVSGLALLAGGVWLLTLDLPGWKLLLGLPAVQLGIIVLMFAFDEATKTKLHPDNYHQLICPFCGFSNLSRADNRPTYCGQCSRKIPHHKPNIKYSLSRKK